MMPFLLFAKQPNLVDEKWMILTDALSTEVLAEKGNVEIVKWCDTNPGLIAFALVQF